MEQFTCLGFLRASSADTRQILCLLPIFYRLREEEGKDQWILLNLSFASVLGLICDLNVCFWFVTQWNFIYHIQKKNGIVNVCHKPPFPQTTPYWRWDMIWYWMFLHYTYCSISSNGKILVTIIFIPGIYTIYNWNVLCATPCIVCPISW